MTMQPPDKIKGNATFCLAMAIIHLILMILNIEDTDTMRFLITQTNIWLVASWIIGSLKP